MRMAEKHMDLLTEDHLRELMADQETPCVSIYMPTHRRGPEVQQDPIRLKNLAREAEDKLVAEGMRPTEAADLLAPAVTLSENSSFWQRQCDGLAMFLTRERQWIFRLPLHFDELTSTAQHFYLKPLLPLFTGDGKFYVLALSQGNVRLLQGSRFTINEIALNDLPKSLSEALRSEDFEIALQFHIGMVRGTVQGKGTPVYHGHGGADPDNLKPRILDYFHKVDVSLRDLLGAERAPLILAGIDYIRGIYQEANHYEHLLDDWINEQPERLSDAELHRRAWEVVAPLYQRERQAALDRFRQLAGTGNKQARSDVETIVPSAYYKLVETLFVTPDQQDWGVFDPEKNQVARHDKPQPGDEDLLDLAVVHTLRNGGLVYQVASEEMPDHAAAAATLRL